MTEKNSFPSLLLETEKKKKRERQKNFKYQHNRVSEDYRPGCSSPRDKGSHGGPKCYWPFVPTLWESLCVTSTQAGPLNLQVRSSE